jgi:hypothetical protein
LSLRRFPLATTLSQLVEAPLSLDDSSRITWQQILSGQPLLYYARQRNLNYRSDVIGLSAPVLTNDEEAGQVTQIEDRVRDIQAFTVYSNLRGAATDQARVEMTTLFGASNVLNNDLLLGGAIFELEAAMTNNDGSISRATVLSIAERYTEPGMGNGIEALVAVEPTLASNSNNARAIRLSRLVPEIDALARAAVRPIFPIRPTLPTLPTIPILTRPILVDPGTF